MSGIEQQASSSSSSSSLAFVPRKLGAGSTRGRGRGRRPGVSSSSSSTSARPRPRPPPQLLRHDVDFPQDTLLHATVPLDVGSVTSEPQQRQRIDRLVRRKLERLAPRSVDYVALRRVRRGDGDAGGGDGDEEEERRVLVECIIRSPSSLKARRLIDKYDDSKATTLPDPRRHRQRKTGVVSLRMLTLPEQAAVWRDEVPKGVKTRARRRAKRRAKQGEDDEAKSKMSAGLVGKR